MKGFRVQPQASKKEAQRQIETEMQNIQMAAKISQMMIQQLMQNLKSMSDDLGNALNQLFEMQYKYTALQKHLNIDSAALDTIANELRLKDFDTASVSADSKENLEVGETILENSTITITSSATDEKGEERGIFRSRIKLSESGVPDMVTKLTGKKVGDKVEVTLNGLNHLVEVLAIRNPKQETTTEVTH